MLWRRRSRLPSSSCAGSTRRHAFGDLESYVRSQLAEPSSEGPLDRLAREAASGARMSLRGKRPEILDAAIASALRETIFRFDLVLASS